MIFEGTILKMIQDSVKFLRTQTKERTYLGSDGRFVNEEEYPKFVQQEIIVNAVTHRSYNIMGTDIQIKMFDDHISVESPGRLPGVVKVDNIWHTHFSRNPKIAEYLKAYEYVKEYGEGVPRMFKELEDVGLNRPQYYMDAFMLKTVVYNNLIDRKNERLKDKKTTIDRKNERLKDKKTIISKKNERLKEKWMIAKVEEAYNKGDITATVYNNVLKILMEFKDTDIIGRKEVREKLGYSDSKAARIIEKMLRLGLLNVLHKAGKGKYRLKNENEE